MAIGVFVPRDTPPVACPTVRTRPFCHEFVCEKINIPPLGFHDKEKRKKD